MSVDVNPTSDVASQLRDRLDRVLEMTQEIFSGDVNVVEKDDPEIPDESYLSIRVVASGSVDEIVAMNREWHRQLVAVDRDASGLFRLAIDVT